MRHAAQSQMDCMKACLRRDLGLAYAEDAQYQLAVNNLWEVVSRPWYDRFPDIEPVALAELNAIIARTPQGTQADTSRMDARLLRNHTLDARAVLSWDTETPISTCGLPTRITRKFILTTDWVIRAVICRVTSPAAMSRKSSHCAAKNLASTWAGAFLRQPPAGCLGSYHPDVAAEHRLWHIAAEG